MEFCIYHIQSALRVCAGGCYGRKRRRFAKKRSAASRLRIGRGKLDARDACTTYVSIRARSLAYFDIGKRIYRLVAVSIFCRLIPGTDAQHCLHACLGRRIKFGDNIADEEDFVSR